jgi:hypothetical protein
MYAEWRGGFPRLRRIPSANVVRSLDYFATLDDARRQALIDSLATLGAMRFYPPPQIREDALRLIDSDPPLVAWREAARSPEFSMGLRYEGIRMRKAMLSDPMSIRMMAETRAKLTFTPRDDMPPELVPDPEHLNPAKAPLFRKLINAEFKPLLPDKRTLPGGEIVYTGTVDDTATTLRVNFGGMGMQLRYSVTLGAAGDAHRLLTTAYEDLWMAGAGWDYITEQKAEDSIQLLGELVREMIRLRNAVAAQ